LLLLRFTHISTLLTPEFLFPQLHDEWADLHAPCDGFQGALGALLHMKQKYPHLQVFLSIGNPSSADIFPLVASNAVLRDRFARSAWKFAEASGLDGIDSKSFPTCPFLPRQTRLLSPFGG
jgi:GH18 family chitinase